MSDPTSVTAETATDAQRLRRRRLRAFLLSFVVLATIPTALQLELRRGGRLSSMRVLGPVAEAGGGAAVTPLKQKLAAAGVNRPVPLYYGAVREAAPSDLERRAGLSPGQALEAAELVPADATAQPASLVTTEPGDPFALPSTPASFGGGGPTTFVPSPPTSTPSTPGTPNPPVITSPPTNPVVTTPPVTNPTDPGTPTPPVIVITPTTPTGGNPGNPGNPDPGGPGPVFPGGPQVTTPTDPGGPGPVDPTGPQQPLAPGGPAGVPEPAVWIELIAGFGLAGAALRRRRQPLTTFAARSNALTVVSRLG